MFRRRSSRRVELRKSGAWYMALTIVLGVAAISSGNNVVYLLESLLLSGLIYSGVFSELAVSRIEVEIRRGSAIVGELAGDEILVTNRSRFPFFSIEIGDWYKNQFELIAFVPMIKGRSTISVRSKKKYMHRGISEWHAAAVSTTYPFGFTRRLFLQWEEGSRIVWPARLNKRKEREASARRANAEPEFVDGEIRELSEMDDAKLVHWLLSERHGSLVGRVRRGGNADDTVRLVFTEDEPREEAISYAASAFYAAGGRARRLLIEDKMHSQEVSGPLACLNALALLPEEGNATHRI